MKPLVADTAKSLTISRLRALTAVAEDGSFSGAARRLGISHSAVSQQIREIESALGIRVLERDQGRLRPSPIGAELCQIGERILEAEREAARIIARRDASGRMHLRVGLGNSMPGMSIIARVCASHPDLAITLHSGSHSDIMAAVQRRAVDVGVLPDVPADPRFRRQMVLRQDVVAIASMAWDLPEGHPTSLAELARAPLIFRSRGSSTQRIVDRAFRGLGLAPIPRLVADTRDAVFEAVVAEVGIGFMWRFGTVRTGLVKRLTVPELFLHSEEMVFALGDERNPALDRFFLAARQVGDDLGQSEPR